MIRAAIYLSPWLFRSRAALACLAFALTVGLACDPPASGVIATGYAGPVYVEAYEDSILVVQRQGQILRQNAAGTRTLWLDISDRVFPSTGGEQGLLSISFRPDGSGDFALFYVDRSNRTTVSVFEGGVERVLLQIPQTREFHKGGTVEFSPVDGFLYAAFGDDGTGDNSRNPATLKGKLVQIDVDAGTAEIVGMGLRNPYRFSFDTLTGDLYLTDVGSTIAEEINMIPVGTLAAGAVLDFGWPEWEGQNCKTAPCVRGTEWFPVYEYANDASTCALIGGHVHRGSVAWLGGAYLFADLCAGRVWALFGDQRVDVSSWMGLPTQTQIVAVEPDWRGRIVVTRLNGSLLRVE